MYFPSRSNSRLTVSPGCTWPILVCSNVNGIMATVKLFFLTSKAVRLMPLTQIDPFSMISSANFLGNSNTYSQLPVFFLTRLQIPVVSTWPWTKCPSIRLLNKSERSIFTGVPGCQEPRLVFLSVSSIAVTLCNWP